MPFNELEVFGVPINQLAHEIALILVQKQFPGEWNDMQLILYEYTNALQRARTAIKDYVNYHYRVWL